MHSPPPPTALVVVVLAALKHISAPIFLLNKELLQSCSIDYREASASCSSPRGQARVEGVGEWAEGSACSYAYL